MKSLIIVILILSFSLPLSSQLKLPKSDSGIIYNDSLEKLDSLSGVLEYKTIDKGLDSVFAVTTNFLSSNKEVFKYKNIKLNIISHLADSSVLFQVEGSIPIEFISLYNHLYGCVSYSGYHIFIYNNFRETKFDLGDFFVSTNSFFYIRNRPIDIYSYYEPISWYYLYRNNCFYEVEIKQKSNE